MLTEPVSAALALDEAVDWLRAEPVDRDDQARNAAMGQAWALVSLAASALVPEPAEIAEQVMADLDEETTQIRERLAEVRSILTSGSRSGPRHPAIHRALEVLSALDS